MPRALSRPAQRVGYALVLRIPGAPRTFVFATLTRLSYGTVSLSLLLTVQGATGSFTLAGAALGAYGLAGVLAPLKSRAIDRYGRRRILPPLALSYAGALLAITLLAATGLATGAAYVALCLAAGVLTPPVGPVMRGIWAALCPDMANRQRAYALDAVAEESVYTVGPVLVGVLVAISTPPVALAVTAALALVGAVGLATSALFLAAPPATHPADGRHRVLGPLTIAPLRWVLLVMLAAGVGVTVLDLAVVATATDAGHPATAGYLLAALSVGSVAGGLLWGRREHRGGHPAQLLTLLAAVSAAAVLAGLAPTLAALAPALFLAGLAVAPVYVVAYLAADLLTPASMRTEATTWIATASNLGGAAGAWTAGYLIERTSARTTVFLAALELALAALALACRRPATGAPPPVPDRS